MTRIICLLIVFHAGIAAGAESDSGELLPEAVTEVEPTVVGTRDYDDPLENLNRAVFAFNDVAYRYFLIPVSNGYITVLPAPVRDGVSGVFHNIREPMYAVNHVLQGRLGAAGSNVLRFLTNTTLGIFGIFDPAESWFDVADADTSLNETLGRYRIGRGFYLVLPILGPSDVRSGTAGIAESYLLHPVRYLADSPEDGYIIVFDRFQQFAPSADTYLRLSDEAEDPYLYFRNQYLQGLARDREALEDGE